MICTLPALTHQLQPIIALAKAALDAWTDTAGIDSGSLFRPLRRRGHVQPRGMTTQAVFDVVAGYARALGVCVSPHELRRTSAPCDVLGLRL